MMVRKEDMPQPHAAQEQQKPTKDRLMVFALKQRIGEITSDYEEKIADLRAEATQSFEKLNEVLRDQDSQIESLQVQLRAYQDAAIQEEDSATTAGTDDTAAAYDSDKD
jgi:F0F1-type ATP synthase membrane subunit b/b'